MPDESPDPSHPLDAGLRAQAARRKAELGTVEPVMPGAMRAQLQSEVALQQRREDRAQAGRPGFLSWFFQWQRALATVGVTLVIVGFFAWNEGWFAPRETTVAKQSAQNEKPLSAVGAAAPREADAATKRLDAPMASFDAKEQSKPAPVISAPADAVAGGKLEAAPKMSQPAAPSVASAPAASAPPASEPRSEAFASKSANVAGLRQNFVQSPAQGGERARRAMAKDAKDERAAPLLNEFEFRQDGNRIEIVDADGSIYAGEIESRLKKDKVLAETGRDQAAARAGAAKPPGTKAKNAEVAVEFNFRASGMNNTLRQQVTIEGNYQSPAGAEAQNATGAVAAGGANTQDELKAAQAQAKRESQSRARVVGRAQVNGRDVQVDAEATK